MSDLFPYLRTLVVDSLAGKSLSDKFHRKGELVDALQRQVEVTTEAHGIGDLIDSETFSEYLFDTLVEGKIIRTNQQEFAGTYYRVNNAQLAAFRSNFLKSDAIAQAANQIGERFFPDVFEGYRASQGFDAPSVGQPIPKSVILQQDWSQISANISEQARADIKEKVAVLIQAIEQSDLDERLKNNAKRRAESVATLLEAPDPPWEIIVDLLNNRYFAAILNTMAILQLILGVVL